MSIQLIGSGWQNQTEVAFYAINILTCLVLILCLGLATRFKWGTIHGLGPLKTIGYVLATTAMLLYFIAALVQNYLSESDAIVSNDYYVFYIFGALFWRVGGVLILGLVLAVIHHRFYIDCNATTSLSRTISTVTIVALALITLLSAAAWAIFAVINVKRIDDPYYTSNLSVIFIDIDMAYDALYILVTIAIFPPALILLFRRRSPASILLPSLIVPSLILRTVMEVIKEVVPTYDAPYSSTDVINLEWASEFLYCFANIAVFLGVAVIAMQRPPSKSLGKNPRDYGESGVGNSVP